jgi:hypothetical protein
MPHILQKKRFRAFGLQNSANMEKHIAAIFPGFFKTALKPGLRKRLTGKTRAQHVKIGEIGHGDFTNIFGKGAAFKQRRIMPIKILLIYRARRIINLASEDAFRAFCRKSQMKPADPRE